MSTFSQWLASVKKTPEPRQITWVCGSERILVEEVVEHVIAHIHTEPWNLVHLALGEETERDVWLALDQHPMGGSPKLVVVRHADQITDWAKFTTWVKDRRRNPRTYVVLVSDEERLPRTAPDQQARRRGEKPELLPHVACIGARGHTVECRQFTATTAPKALEWIKSKVPVRDQVARHLLTRANWDLRLVRDTCLKLEMFPGEASVPVVNALMAEQPRDTFTDALLALDRKTAFLAARDVRDDDLPRTIGLLDSKLDTASIIHSMQVEHRSNSEMARELGPLAFLLPDLLKVAKHYDAKRVMSTRQVLAVADQAVRSGQREGVLELVVALW